MGTPMLAVTARSERIVEIDHDESFVREDVRVVPAIESRRGALSYGHPE